MMVNANTLEIKSGLQLPSESVNSINSQLVDGDYLIVTTNSAHIYKIYLPDMSIVGHIQLSAGAAHHIEKWKGNYYITMQTDPGQFIKIDSNNFTEVQKVVMNGFNRKIPRTAYQRTYSNQIVKSNNSYVRHL